MFDRHSVISKTTLFVIVTNKSKTTYDIENLVCLVK